MRKIWLYFCVMLSLVAIGTFCSSSATVYAYTLGSNNTMDKIVTKNTQSAVRIFKSPITPLALKDNRDHLPFDNDGDSCTVPMPNTLISGSSSSSPKLTCYDFLVGNNQWSGVMSKPNLSGDNPSTYGNYLESVGYRKASFEGIDMKCLYAFVSNPDITDASGNAYENQPTANRICSEVYDDTIGTLQLNDYPNNAKYQFRLDTSGNRYTTILYHDNDIMTSVRDIIPGTTKWSSFVRSWENAAADWNNGRLRTTISDIKTTSSSLGSDSSEVTFGTDYEKTTTEAIMQAILGSSTVNTLSTAEVYNIYAQYLANTSHVVLSCGTTIDYANDGAYNWLQVKLKRDGEISDNCYVHEVGTTLYTGASSARRSGYYFTRENMTLSDIVNQINSFDLESIIDDLDDFNNPSSSISDNSGDSGNSEEDPCYNAGVEGMSWILCPTIDNTANAVDGIESVLRGWLQIDTNQIFRSQTYDAWNVFRNIANALIIIVLLVIIFSQLTGVGIDNYGIKKMLPRLVIMAILINLSYIVCELAVDLSNILGVGLNNMFESIGTAIRGGSGAAAETVATIVDALLATLAGAGAVAGTVITIVGIAEGGGVMLIISLVLVLLVALVAVLMFFVMLGSRMVIVIMFTVIAPVAFACYILPNTQGLFKKWWKVFQAALVIFPICGALYGMSFVIKAIIFGGGDVDFIMALIAVCVPFLPFLLLPTLLRSALAGLGALGGTLTMMGNGLRRGLSSGNTAIRNTDRYKSALERNAENRTRFKAGLDGQGKEIKMGRFGRFVRGGDRGVARARMQYVKDQNKQALEDRMIDSNGAGFEAALISQRKAAEADMVKDYMTLINSRTNNGENETELGRMLDSYISSGNKMGAVAVARIAGRRKDTASGFLTKYFNDTGGYSSELREALAKEIATGENSANYRESSPFGFEFAAQTNKGEAGATDYSAWLGHQDTSGSYDNVHRAMNNYVTNSKDLVGMKGGALKELAKLMREGGIDASDAERLRGVARDAIRNRGTTGVWDSTKEQQIYEIAGLPYPPVDASAGRRTGGSGGRSSGDIPDGYTQTDSGIIIPH